MFNPERIAKICEALERGETDAMAAKIGGISPQTFCEWKNTKPEFLEAVKRAKAAFEDWRLNGILEDATRSLKTLVCGQEYDEIKTEYEANPKDPNTPRIKKQTRTTKKVLPNATAVIFALCNRDPDHWKNRVENEITGKLDTDGDSRISLEKVPDGLLAEFIKAMRGE